VQSAFAVKPRLCLKMNLPQDVAPEIAIREMEVIEAGE